MTCARFRPVRQGEQRRRELEANEFERAKNLELFDVLRQVARGHPLVDVLVPRKFAELVDARFHIMPSGPLATHDRTEVDPILHALVGGNRIVRDRDPQRLLRLHYRNPKLALEPHFSLD